MQLSETYRYLINELRHIYDARESQSIAKLLLESMGFSTLRLSLEPSMTLSGEEVQTLMDQLDELRKNKPVQYVLGRADFYGLTFKVNGNVLIPRQETEELVNLIIKENTVHNPSILDIGTGSGCIAITLAHNLKSAKVFATDISEKALEIAMKNALLNKVSVYFILDSILDPKFFGEKDFLDIIVSNPPYILQNEAEYINLNVLAYEPWHALFADPSDPLLFYRKIFAFTKKHLKPDGCFYCEINEKLGRETMDLALSFGFTNVKLIMDINGKERILKGSCS